MKRKSKSRIKTENEVLDYLVKRAIEPFPAPFDNFQKATLRAFLLPFVLARSENDLFLLLRDIEE